MIEAAMYVALGFCTAGLIGLAILPAFYRRAARLTEEALRAVNPSSYAEVRAAQDQARALHAVELRRVETQLDHEREKAARFHMESSRLKAEISEQSRLSQNRIDELESRIAAIAGNDQAIDLLTAEIGTLKEKLAEAEKALADSWAEDRKEGSPDKAKDTTASEEEDVSWLPATDTMMLATITGLEAEVATLKAKLSSYEPTVASEIDASLREAAKARLAELEGQLVDTESKYIAAQAEVTRLSLLLDSANASEADLQKALDSQLQSLAEENARHQSDLESKDRLLRRMAGQVERLREDLSRSPALLELRKELKTLAARVVSADTVTISSAQPPAGPAATPSSVPGKALAAPAPTAPVQKKAQPLAQLQQKGGTTRKLDTSDLKPVRTAPGETDNAPAASDPTVPKEQEPTKSANIANAADALVSRIMASNRSKLAASEVGKRKEPAKAPAPSPPSADADSQKAKVGKAKKDVA
ncbi:hypothetical protein FMN50_18815 [Rhodobacterales bacterium]|nr:hypothetical protein FMN50_18815 [Rhodobacterales bacterium]